MKIRNLPFGYCIQDGKICIDGARANTVRSIFDNYIKMASYIKVADMLTRQGMPYLPEKRWNKNIVARILKDRRYLGDSTYPQILAQEVFHQAESANSWSCQSPEQVRTVKNLRALVCCPSCGKPMARNFRSNWRCPDCMVSSVKVTDESLMASVAELLARLAEAESDIKIPDVTPNAVPDLEYELEQLMGAAEYDESAAKAKAMELASARLNELGSEDYETMRIKYMLSSQEQDGKLDIDLLFDITSAILIHSSGAVSLKLKNGQIIERS